MTNYDDMLKFNSDLRSDAREQLREKWGGAILACVLYSIITGSTGAAGGIITLIVGGPLELGLAGYFLMITRQHSPQMEHLFKGFRNFERALVFYIVRTVFIVLWSLLFIIPGIIAALRYSMAAYILYDNPEISGMEALERSKEMMDGRKGKLFGLYLSFIGWAILCIFTLGIGFLWLYPYIKASEANFYEEVKKAEGGM
jgi:uncharacterized membrane protein